MAAVVTVVVTAGAVLLGCTLASATRGGSGGGLAVIPRGLECPPTADKRGRSTRDQQDHPSTIGAAPIDTVVQLHIGLGAALTAFAVGDGDLVVDGGGRDRRSLAGRLVGQTQRAFGRA